MLGEGVVVQYHSLVDPLPLTWRVKTLLIAFVSETLVAPRLLVLEAAVDAAVVASALPVDKLAPESLRPSLEMQRSVLQTMMAEMLPAKMVGIAAMATEEVLSQH